MTAREQASFSQACRLNDLSAEAILRGRYAAAAVYTLHAAVYAVSPEAKEALYQRYDWLMDEAEKAHLLTATRCLTVH